MEPPAGQLEPSASWRSPGITMEKEDGTESRRERSTLPDVPSDGVLVKTICAGLSSQKQTGGDEKQKMYSNEICGRVLSVGSKVPADCSVKPGDVVIVYPWLGCGQCETCSSGSTYLCEEISSDKNSSEPNSFALASYLVIQEWQNLIKLPKEIPKDIGCMLPYWALRVYAAILEAKPSFEQAVLIRGFANLLVIGCSNLELWCIAFLKNVFCDRNVKVICAESDQASLNLALESGADDVVLWKEGASVEEILDATTMSGYNKMDVVIDLVGNATAFAVAFLTLHNGGTILELGTKVQPVDLPLALLIEKSVTIKAIKAGSRYTLKQLVDLLAIQRVTLSIPIESFYIEDLNVARESLDKGQVKGHAIVRYDE